MLVAPFKSSNWIEFAFNHSSSRTQYGQAGPLGSVYKTITANEEQNKIMYYVIFIFFSYL